MLFALINKDTLQLICSSKKVSAEYIAQKCHFIKNRLDRWLDSTDPLLPTIKQAKTLAACLHFPFAGLYMNPQDIPVRALPKMKNMRTVWGGGIEDDSALNIAVIDLLFERDFLKETNRELGIPSIAFSIPAPYGDVPSQWATELRQSFGLSLDHQYKCQSTRQFYLYLRSKIEATGIFIHSFTDVLVEDVRGFAIYDSECPIIGINDNDRSPAKSFTIIHELVHILKRESSLCNDMFGVRGSMSEEVFCNAVAGELLVPQDALALLLRDKAFAGAITKDNIELLARKFSVSREVITRRLLSEGIITGTEYDTFIELFRQELEHEKEEARIARQNGLTTGPRKIVGRDAVDRTSPSVCRCLLQGYSADLFSKRDIAHHLNIAEKHVDRFLSEVSKWNN